MNMITNIYNMHSDKFTAHDDSKILAPVCKRELRGIGKDRELPVDRFVGTYACHDGEPQFLGVVGENFELVQMRTLVNKAQTEMRNMFTPSELDSIEINDKSGGNGAMVERRYTIKAFEEALTYGNRTAATLEVGTTVAAELRIKTGFDGNTKTLLLSGMNDLVCKNGMVNFRLCDSVSKKHTPNNTTEVFRVWIEQALPAFAEQVEILQNWCDTPVNAHAVEETIRNLPGISERGAQKMIDRVHYEVLNRGSNYYAVVSALTYYSSHNSTDFPIRQTGNDNVAATLADREQQVNRWINSAPMRELAAA